jgi:hypothetical protein
MILLSVSSLPVTCVAFHMGWRNLVLASLAERWIRPRPAIDVYLQNVPNLFGRKQVRLRLRGQVDHLKRTMRADPPAAIWMEPRLSGGVRQPGEAAHR